MVPLITGGASEAVMTDVMIDIETTGTDPYHNAMLQLAAIQFNYETEEIGPVFDRCLMIPMGRYWDEECRVKFWRPKQRVLNEILARGEEPEPVMIDFWQYIVQAGRPLRFWARGNFDWWFIQSYLHQFQRPMPFQFWESRDLRSYISGRFGQPKEPDLTWLAATVKGDAHNALFDSVVQLKQLFAARNQQWGEVLPPLDEVS